MSIDVIVVEDNYLVAEDLRQLSAELGLNCVAACHSYEEALDTIRSRQPHLLILNIQMEGNFDGLKIAANIHSELPQTKIIYLTGMTPQDVHDSRSELASVFLEKPVVLESLREAVEKVFPEHLR